MGTNVKSASTYPDADRDTVFEEGLEFQDFVGDLFLKEVGLLITNYASRYYQSTCGENRQGIEIKLDRRILHHPTGNISIEIQEKSKASNDFWVDSGILRQDNAWLYVQGAYDKNTGKYLIFVFGKKFLKQLYQTGKYKTWEPKRTIRTFLMPISDARKYALKIFET